MTEQSRLDQDDPGSKSTFGVAAEYAALGDTLPPPDAERIDAQSASEMREAAQEVRAAQIGWLERRGVLEDTTRLTMPRREFELLRDVGLGDNAGLTSLLIEKAKQNYDIPPDASRVLVDIAPSDPSLPRVSKLMEADEEDFGTTIDEERIADYGIETEGVPRIGVTQREFELLRIAGADRKNASSLIRHARGLYGIPDEDQYAPEYALIDIEPEDPNLPPEPLLVIVNEVDFGTVIGSEIVDRDNDYLNHASDPDNPLTPESGGSFAAVDIAATITRSSQGLQAFAKELMKGETANPLRGQFWIRAGGIAPGQRDAYVWENSTPFTEAVALTMNTPGQYSSVCAVVGERRDPGNGKAGMAQIFDPEVILTIEGDDLSRLQDVYRGLYREPNFALTEQQRRERDETFNNYLIHYIDTEARKNQAYKDDEERRRRDRQQPQLRARPIPGRDPYR